MPKKIADSIIVFIMPVKDAEKRIKSVGFLSPAYRAGVSKGDYLLSVNGNKISDIFDYRYFSADENPVFEVLDSSGTVKNCALKKPEYADPGIEFYNPMLSCDRHCANKCIFCFIDQMPPGMRDSLYFKDDDLRLSFLTGNYATLTNCGIQELKRLAGYHISPINVSIHTMNPELRVKMLGNKNAGDIYEKLMILLEAGITVNGQIVLVPGVNDGAELKKTLDILLDMPENFESVCIVPVGVTKFRDSLYNLRPQTKEEAGDVIALVNDYRQMAKIKRGCSFVYCSDEFYINAGVEIPEADEYDGFPQLEDGVGTVALLKAQVEEALSSPDSELLRLFKRAKNKKITGTIATGVIAEKTICELTRLVGKRLSEYGSSFEIKVVAVENRFFGETVTVSGLLTGGDIVGKLKGMSLGGRVLITENMLRSGENVFLDDLTTRDVEKALGVKLVPVGKTGRDFVKALLS